jgi:hypothetical protein
MSFLLEKIKSKTMIFVDKQKLLNLYLGQDMFKTLDYGIGFLRFQQQLVKKCFDSALLVGVYYNSPL